MSDLWKYTEDCDGDYCPMNCDHCNREENESDNSMLFMFQSGTHRTDVLSQAPHIRRQEQASVRESRVCYVPLSEASRRDTPQL